MNYTVIVKYPPLPLADTLETLTAWVVADDERSAIRATQRKVLNCLSNAERRGLRAKHFTPVAVITGHTPVYNPQTQCHLAPRL